MEVAIILGLAVLAGLGVGFYLVRDVSSAIDSITQPMQALGRGDHSAASSQVLSAAQMLSNDSTRLKTEVSKFLTNVRAA